MVVAGRTAGVLGHPRLRLTLLGLFLAAAIALAVTVGGPNRAEVEDTVRDAGMAGPLVFVAGTFAFAVLGGPFEDPTSPVFLTAVGLLVALAAGGPLLNRLVRARGLDPPEESADDATVEGQSSSTG